MGFAKSRPAAQGILRGPAVRFTVHILRSSLEFWSALFYSACSDLCFRRAAGREVCLGPWPFAVKCALGREPAFSKTHLLMTLFKNHF